MPKCKFTTYYIDYESHKHIDFYCDNVEPLASGFCIFHDKEYLQDKTNYEKRKRKVLARLKSKVNHAISNNEPILCIGFQLPDFSLSDLSINKQFNIPVYFSGSQFFGKVDFSGAKFKGIASFDRAKFQEEAHLGAAKFQRAAFFDEANFQGEADFYGDTFEGEAFFPAANFQRKASFSQANFQRKVSFTGAKFQELAYFYLTTFEEEASFYGAKFQGEVDFSDATFQGEVDFRYSELHSKTIFSGQFNAETKFHYVLFEGKGKIIFDIVNLSNVSFTNTDLTGVRFSAQAKWGEKEVEYNKFWGGKKVKEGRFKVIDERILEEKINKEKDGHSTKDFNLGSIKAVYRNLRENYEYRMRYDEAGQFFIREMELKRKYREVPSKEEKEGDEDNNAEGEEQPQPEPEKEQPQPEPEKEQEEDILEIKQNNWFRRNLFSLTGWYYHLSRYGESIWRPTLAGLVIVLISTLFWSTQNNPLLQPTLNATIVISDANLNYTTSTINTNGSLNNNQVVDANKLINKTANYFIGFQKANETSQWLRAFERSLADFLPLLPTGDFKMGIIDYVIKIIGGAVTFGLIAIALRRRFERRYRH